MEEAKLLQSEFSTADVESPKFQYGSGTVTLEYVDWQEKPVRIVFSDVLGVRWQDAEPPHETYRDDSTYEVVGSSWLQEHIDQKMTNKGVQYKHLKLCFNAAGVFDILCSKFELET